MNLEELLVDYFQSAYQNIVLSFPQGYKEFKECTTEVEGMYFLDVLINGSFVLPCMVYWRNSLSVSVFTNHKQTKNLKQFLKKKAG